MAADRRSSMRRGAFVLAVLVAAAAIAYVKLSADGRGADDARALAHEVRGAEPESAALAPAESVPARSRAVPATLAAEEAEPDAPPPLLAAPVTGRIVVTVRELTHLPVQAARVVLHPTERGGTRGERWIDAEGRCVFEDVLAGTYWASVDGDSLVPEGYLPPAMQASSNPYWRDPTWSKLNPGYYHDEVVIDETQREARLELVVAAPAFARGHVYDAAGKGVEKVTVDFFTMGIGAHVPTAVTDEQGAYEIDDLRRGSYFPRLQFHLHEEYPPGPDGRPVSESSVPPPEPLEVFPGDVVVRDFHLGQGSGEIVGRVVDQHGEPVADLDVLAYYEGLSTGSTAATGRTRVDGTFALTDLSRARLRVLVGGVWAAHPGPDRTGKKVLGEYPDTLDVDLTDAARVDLGDVKVWRLEFVRFEGRVSVSAAARERYAIDELDSDGRVELYLHDESEAMRHRGSCDLSPDGSYTLELSTRSSGDRYAVLELLVSVYRVQSDPIWIPHHATSIRHDFVVD